MNTLNEKQKNMSKDAYYRIYESIMADKHVFATNKEKQQLSFGLLGAIAWAMKVDQANAERQKTYKWWPQPLPKLAKVKPSRTKR